MHVSAIVLTNSLAYVREVFAAARARRTLAGVQAGRTPALPGIRIDRLIEPGVQFGWHAERQELSGLDQPAQVVLTSGTEGQPKAILLSYENQADAARRLIAAQQLTGEVREYVGVPVTYSFGMGRFRAIAAVGGRAYLPPKGFDPLELSRMLRNGEVNALSAVPTLLRILLDEPALLGDAGRKLRWLEIGSQYMAAGEKRRIRALFPEARIIQHYGLTEASRSTFLDISHASDDVLDSVGQAHAPVELGLDGNGRIRIRGPHVARWHVDAQGLHALCDAQGWLQTNDLGHLRDGYLFFDGRADDLINCGGVKVVPEVLEERILAKLGSGRRIAVARVRDESRGEAVLVASEGDAGTLPGLQQAAAAALGEMGIGAAGNLHVRHVDAIPMTATGKPIRRELSAGFRPETATAPAAAGEAQTVRALFERHFPGAKVGPQDSFESLGGDSLRYIRFSMEFERRFGFSPPQWEALTVAQLQQQVDSQAARGVATLGWRLLEPSTLLRAIAILFIVTRHADSFVYSRNFAAGQLLFALGGYTLARFQLPEVLRKGSVRSILGTAALVAIPTLLVTVPSQIMTHTFEPLQYLLVSNFTDPLTSARLSFYFAEIYLQLFLLAALLFSFPRVRALFSKHAFPAAVGLLFAMLVLKYVIGLAWDTNYLFQRVPQFFGWLFALGMVVALARTSNQKLLALGLVAAGALLQWGLEWSSLLLGGGLALTLYVSALRVPGWLKSVAGEVAAASIFIYLIHFQIIALVTHLFGHAMPWVATVAAIAAGVVAAYAYGFALQRLARTRPGKRFFTWIAGERA